MTPVELRKLSAEGKFDKPTSGYCEGYVQANLVALPEIYAADFERFCRANPKPCPLLEIVGPGTTKTSKLASEADLLNTLPRYRVWIDGKNRHEVHEISRFYRPDLVFFLLGCSFSFEDALVKEGISLRHVDHEKNVSMYRTNIPLEAAGPFHGEMVVSMRPIHCTKVALSCIITSRYPGVHGEPVHIGYPEMIGIRNLAQIDYGDAVEVKKEEIPVFWACGVTPQNVLINAKLPFAVTHAPGYMFVGDQKNEDFVV